MRASGDAAHGRRLRGLIVIMWRAGLRIQEALALTEGDLDPRRGAVLVRRGKGARRREVGWTHGDGSSSSPGLTCGARSRSVRCCASSTARRADGTGRRLRHVPSCGAPPAPQECGVAFAPHQLRHAHAVEMAREGVPLIVIQRQLGHSNLGITSRLPPGHRQRRDHRDRPRPTRADDPSQRLAAALIECPRRRCSRKDGMNRGPLRSARETRANDNCRSCGGGPNGDRSRV
jgi:integrase